MSNEPAKVEFREKVLAFEDIIRGMITSGAEAFSDDDKLTHSFTYKDEKFDCYVYARSLTVPKGSVLVGKIHRFAHLNFLMKGKMAVASENGKRVYEAPAIVMSGPGIKKIGYALEDSIWTTVHLTEHAGEENLKTIEDEIVAETYAELGLISSVEELKQLEGER